MRDAALRTLRLINGEQEIGRSWGFWIAALAFVICLIALPKFVSGYALLNYSYILSRSSSHWDYVLSGVSPAF